MISHKHRCVYVHIPKCGGQSVEHVFLKENGLTWETRDLLLLRPNDDPSRGPPRLAHLTWQEYIGFGYISAELMRTYSTFTVVRDPYKRVESLYRFLKYDTAISFEQFVLVVLRREIITRSDDYWFVRPQHEYISDTNGTIRVGKVIKLEHINEQLPPVLSGMGISNPVIPHVNKAGKGGMLSSIRNRFRHARRGSYSLSPRVASEIVWNDETRTTVQALYKGDFEQFGY